uniref:Uncharacterized protein n=1 Tax=Fusarium oxysporum (strain Fo5176) TaxID=660025 RepID=A0A0D2XF71_FUSOF
MIPLIQLLGLIPLIQLPGLIPHQSPALPMRNNCGSLGRPICTYETRNTKDEKGYSSAIDMAAIIEAVLREVYGPSKVSRHFITTMTQEHRSWATRMASGLKADGLEGVELVQGSEYVPTLASSNMKQSYYWSIMLLTRPVLLDRAATHAMRGGVSDNSYRDQQGAPPPSHADTALVYASVDSAVSLPLQIWTTFSRCNQI